MTLDIPNRVAQLINVVDEHAPAIRAPRSGNRSIVLAELLQRMNASAREFHSRFRFEMSRDLFDRTFMTRDDKVCMVVTDAERVDEVVSFSDPLGKSIRDSDPLRFVASHGWILQRLLRS